MARPWAPTRWAAARWAAARWASSRRASARWAAARWASSRRASARWAAAGWASSRCASRRTPTRSAAAGWASSRRASRRAQARWAQAAAGLAAVAVLLAGCGSASPAAQPAAGGSTATGPHGTITVLAAASLTEAFTRLGNQFQALYPGTTVRFDFGPSSGLAQQIINGAPADVFAPASPTNMNQVVSAGDAANPVTFARNVLEVAVPPDDPAHITALADLVRPGVKVAVCAPQVPCGALAVKVLAAAKLSVHPVTEGTDVKSVLTVVRTGEVDAGLVYVTDVRSAGRAVLGIPIPATVNSATTYPIAAVSRSGNLTTAQAFVAYVTSPTGQQVLTADGFANP